MANQNEHRPGPNWGVFRTRQWQLGFLLGVVAVMIAMFVL